MCGIFFSLGNGEAVHPEETTNGLIRNRGPDCLQTHLVRLSKRSADGSLSSLYLSFISSVLALRGSQVEVQPLVDPVSQSVLCWNGEAWKIADSVVQGNDARRVFQLLLDASAPDSDSEAEKKPLTRLTQAISSIYGPFSFLFYDARSSRIIYSRDYLGRRSLLHGYDDKGNFKISSVCDGTQSKHFEEVGTDGIHVLDLSSLNSPPLAAQSINWFSDANSSPLASVIPCMNKTLPIDSNFPVLNSNSTSVHALERLLRDALSLRVQNIPELHRRSPSGAKVAVLFSGGLDCTVLARLAHDLLPADEPIDLLNVAFENPRVVTAAAAAHRPKIKSLSRLPEVYDDCPDRKTGRSSYEELCRVCPGRKWRFISINIPYSDTLAHRDQIKRLMRPHNTEMDLSIACALYFASRGEGVVDSGPSDNGDESAKGVPYSTSARVLLSGLGADEVFAGYTRHATAFSRSGYKGLIDEIDLDVGRLGKRNLGRDDRIISHWGREARYPYLDEDFLAWALQCPVWEKCGFRNGLDGAVSGAKEKTAAGELEPGKQALRLVAWNLGMKNVAREKKRAIQFGSRTAKMESGRSKGTSLIS